MSLNSSGRFRYYTRDDITAIVVFFDDDALDDAGMAAVTDSEVTKTAIER